jgi:predicted transcriptional regulator
MLDTRSISSRPEGIEMGALSLRLPESLHQKLGELAEREGVSINQLITSAVAEKMSALMTEEYLAARAKRASRRKFEAVLAKVPDIEPEDFDGLPAKTGRPTRKRAG